MQDLHDEVYLDPPLDHYRLTSDGTLYSTKTGKSKTAHLSQSGHPRYTLYDGSGQRLLRSVGRLVALYFVEPPSEYHRDYVIHKDHDLTNNHVSNLEWRSASYAERFMKQRYRVEDYPVMSISVTDTRTGDTYIHHSVHSVAHDLGLLYDEVFYCATHYKTSYTLPWMLLEVYHD